MQISADISAINATEPINDRAGTARPTSRRPTHQRQTNQLAVRIMGASTMTAIVSPRRGASSRTRMVPRINPIKDYDRVDRTRLGRPERLDENGRKRCRAIRQAVPRRLHRPQGARSKAVSCGSICASWVAARRYRPTCRPGRGLHHPSASRTPKSRIPGKPVWC
jgi:hypothetical protein